MPTDLIVNKHEDGLRIAVLENRRLVELHTERADVQFAVGDIMLGKVTRLHPGLNAAFVEVGHAKNGFLHYTDLGPQIKTQSKFLKTALHGGGQSLSLTDIKADRDIDKHGKIGQVLKAGDTILVQIMKEAISSKGPRLSSQLSLAGQYMILMPFSDDVAISRKFKSGNEKRKLKKLLLDVKPNNCGIIVRTAAEGVAFDKLKAELDRLMNRWDELARALIGSRPPKKVLSEMDRTSSVLRDILSIGFDRIFVDDKQTEKEVSNYLAEHLPEKKDILHYRSPKGGIFEAFGIERQIKAAFGRNVNLSNGAYIVIEHTEALHSIDVNSGSQRLNTNSPEETALQINLEAAREVARQLRLRDIGGIIVIDFIDMRRQENRRQVHNVLVEEMSRDRVKHAVLAMSRFGLMQVTRQRARPEVTVQTDETCPSCGGTGKIGPTVLMDEQVEKNVAFLLGEGKAKKLKLVTNPYLAAYLKQGGMFRSRQWKWYRKYNKWIPIEASNKLPFTSVSYVDADGEELVLD